MKITFLHKPAVCGAKIPLRYGRAEGNFSQLHKNHRFLPSIKISLTDSVGDADREGAAFLAVAERVQGVRSLTRLGYEETDIVPVEERRMR